ncbi:hypothetical protein TUM12370_25010 [Salmonella enterica subsp. enterica serovar Choleraesuis]|nr:hypothetical protein TUM12370_25010 [Salmonella enterica subsp. enterica serovar Choleraesuis]
MKKWLLMSAALALTACSSEKGAEYYQLPQPVQSMAASAASTGQRQLWVEQVSIPDYLAGNGIVYQTSDVQYTIANSNLWASPLDQQLKSSLVANLNSALPGWVVSSTPLGASQESLNVNVTGFHGRYDGKVVVSGEWLLNRDGEITRRPFHLEMAQQGDGYPALVKTLGEAWQKESQQIAAQVAVR